MVPSKLCMRALQDQLWTFVCSEAPTSPCLPTHPPDRYSWVTVGAGIRLYDLNERLESLGLSLENMGATAEQSLAGATATGTHGTGSHLGSMSTQVAPSLPMPPPQLWWSPA